jgi:hypothetical protein
MPDLSFAITAAEVTPFAAVPMLTFKLEAANATPAASIHAVLLRCQIQIETPRRPYNAGEEARLRDLFGEPARWGSTLRTMLWTHAQISLPPFTDRCAADLQVPCTFDFNLAATKYFDAVTQSDAALPAARREAQETDGGRDIDADRDVDLGAGGSASANASADAVHGEIPLCFQFSGTVFYRAPGGPDLQVSPISWDKEARFRLPAQRWRDLMDAYYPNSAWLRLRRDAFDRLAAYKMRHAIPTWEEALERLLTMEEGVVHS